MQTRWAILGPGGISGFFARALPNSRFGTLHAVGSSDAGRAAGFAAAHGAAVSGSYEDVLSRDDVDAVYIGTVHTTHARLAEAALAAGKAVLCEKPVTPTLEETEHLLAAAASAGRPLLEAYKWRFGPFAERLASLVAGAAVGEVRGFEASFGFAAEERTGRLFDPDLAGGALLDVGGYPASFGVAIASWAGIALDPVIAEATGDVAGVDESASALVRFGAFTAAIRTSIVEDLPRSAVITGTEGRIVLPDAWGSRLASARTLVVERDGADPVELVLEPVDPFAAEADAVSLALADGRAEIPEFPWDLTRTTARVLSEWRAAL